MARSSTTWKPGQSGNPKGGQKKSRALTAILEKAGNTTAECPDGKRRARKRILADLVWQLVTTGQIALEERVYTVASVDEWLYILRWLYLHIDGPAPKALDVTSDGQAVGSGLSLTELVALMQQADQELGDDEAEGDSE